MNQALKFNVMDDAPGFLCNFFMSVFLCILYFIIIDLIYIQTLPEMRYEKPFKECDKLELF